MPIRLYNTLTKEEQPFEPIDRSKVRMYVCGPTVYDFAHIGNARPAIVFDVLFRLLRHEYGADHVTYVRNITDVDDKINARALRDFPGLPLNDAIRAVTEKTETQYHADVAALGCLPPTHEPRATENIPGMIAIIEKLIAQRHAYQAADEVLFDTQSMPDYGALSRRKLDEQREGARVAVDAHKKHAHDFVLWKLSADNEPGWDSPWGHGRPGWHIECSAMSAAYLGNVFDIHGGGLDLIFPHHENEIAQSRCAHATPMMAKVWMHNGFLQVEGEKMSKSLGNFLTINELLTEWPGEVLRVNMLKRHYRLPIDWTSTGMQESANLWTEWLFALANNPEAVTLAREAPDRLVSPKLIEALSKDLNTHLALQEIHGLRNLTAHSSDAAITLAASMEFMGLLPVDVQGVLNRLSPIPKVDEAAIARAIEARKAARAAKNFAESDRIRDELLAKGIVLKDGPQGTTWEVKK